MLGKSKAYSGFAVDDIDEAKSFYGEKLGIKVTVLDEENGLTQLEHPNQNTLCYLKPDLEPANYTILNFPVDDIDAAVDGLAAKGVEFERYDGFEQDEKGIVRGIANDQGPDIVWFKDPAGNILSVLQES
jgi:catechol 2,3-dioxygenase-like lactoylglutathione lyase family enzyme